MSKFKNVLDAFCARASKFNGLPMVWELEELEGRGRLLTFTSPGHEEVVRVVVGIDKFGLREVYMRMAHLGATVMDKAIFRVVLSEGDANVPPPKPSFEELVGLLG